MLNPELVAWRPAGWPRPDDAGRAVLSRGGIRRLGSANAPKPPVVFDIIMDRLKTAAMESPYGPWPRSATWDRCKSCARPSGVVGAGHRRVAGAVRSTPYRLAADPRADLQEAFARAVDRHSCSCTRVSSSRPPPGSRRRSKTSRSPGRAGRGRADRLRAVLGIVAMRRGEIENCLECVGPSSCIFPIAPRGRPSQPGGLARGDPLVHGLPRRVTAGPARPLALEHRLHDAGRVPRKGPAAST